MPFAQEAIPGVDRLPGLEMEGPKVAEEKMSEENLPGKDKNAHTGHAEHARRG